MGHIYFEVSKHLGIKVSEVIRDKFDPDIRFLIIKYSSILREEQQALEDLKDKAGD